MSKQHIRWNASSLLLRLFVASLCCCCWCVVREQRWRWRCTLLRAMARLQDLVLFLLLQFSWRSFLRQSFFWNSFYCLVCGFLQESENGLSCCFFLPVFTSASCFFFLSILFCVFSRFFWALLATRMCCGVPFLLIYFGHMNVLRSAVLIFSLWRSENRLMMPWTMASMGWGNCEDWIHAVCVCVRADEGTVHLQNGPQTQDSIIPVLTLSEVCWIFCYSWD